MTICCQILACTLTRSFRSRLNVIIFIDQLFLREAYRRLTGDSSASSNATETEVDARIAHLLDTEDPDLVWDLRVNNSGRPETYTTYLEFCQKYIDPGCSVFT